MPPATKTTRRARSPAPKRAKAAEIVEPPVPPNTAPAEMQQRGKRKSTTEPVAVPRSRSASRPKIAKPAAEPKPSSAPPKAPAPAPTPSSASVPLSQQLINPTTLIVLLLLLLPLAVFAVADDVAPASSPPPLAKFGAALLKPLRAAFDRLAALAAACEPLAPALLMAVAAAITWSHRFLAPHLQLHEPAKWALGLAFLVTASVLAARQHAERGGGGGLFFGNLFGSGSADGPPAEPAPLRLAGFEAALHKLRGGGGDGHPPPQWKRLVKWALAWEGAKGGGGGSHKLLLFGEAGGKAASAAIKAFTSDLMPEGSSPHVLTLSTGDECAGGSSCADRIEKHVAAASAANQRALVVLRQVEACASDDHYDGSLSVVERFLDETPYEVTTAHGEVKKALVGFLLVAPCLERSTCEEIEAKGEDAAAYALKGEVEAMWPREKFSNEVNAAKRAFINRLGTDLAVMCG